jgi:hypothetical protein
MHLKSQDREGKDGDEENNSKKGRQRKGSEREK